MVIINNRSVRSNGELSETRLTYTAWDGDLGATAKRPNRSIRIVFTTKRKIKRLGSTSLRSYAATFLLFGLPIGTW